MEMEMKRIRSWVLVGLAAAGLMAAAGGARANNLVVTNTMVRWNTTNTAKVKFDIAWANSWRYTNVNHDAAWVFCKVQTEGDVSNNWQRVMLDGSGTNPPGYSTGTGTEIEIIVPDDGLGLFIRRSAEGSGPVSAQNVQVIWNFASNGLAKTARVRMQVLAVEMVYVAEGSFYVGSGGTTNMESGSFTDGLWTSGATTNPTIPFLITSEAALTITNASGYLWGTSTNTIFAGTLSSNFPKGYNAFYCMKYEITQGQYRDFLNTLTRSQQVARAASLTASNFAMSSNAAIQFRNGIRCPSVIPGTPTNITFGCDGNTNMTFNETNDAMDRACNYLSWADGCAFADWAGLRPMSELEYEKACRGTNEPVANEYAWGSTNIINLTNEASDGTGTSTSTVAGANCLYGSSMQGPARAGIFATTSSSRTNAGASCWGIMELSGNVYERPVTVGDATGRGFTGALGNGVLNASGDADVTNWPGVAGPGSASRGGSWASGSTDERVSGRRLTAGGNATRYFHIGQRGVRPSPSGVGP